MESTDEPKDVKSQENDHDVVNKTAVKTESLTSIEENSTSTKPTTKKSNATTDTTNSNIPSIGTILQTLFYLLMIGQNLPGPHTKFWPFKSTNNERDTKNTIPPRYAELRSDMYGHERQFRPEPEGGLLTNLLLGPKEPSSLIPENTGIPKQQNVVLTLLNREYESYRYSVQAATKSKVVAANEYAKVSFQRALEKSLFRLTNRHDWIRLTIIEERFLEEAGNLLDEISILRGSRIDINASSELGLCNDTQTMPWLPLWNTSSEDSQCNINATSDSLQQNSTSTTLNVTSISPPVNATTNETIRTKTRLLNERIASFFNEITDTLPPGPANHIQDALKGHLSTFGHLLVEDLRNSPMRLHFSVKKKRLFVLYFIGDLFATSVSDLRKEVTAIVRSAESGDEVLVVLQSGGGTVTGYGLVAGQLLRIKEAGLKLTIAVEQVAASGGYMAACIGDTIVCSPFAVLGSIGVIQEVPNIHERLKREGVEFHQVTAGEWKRVLSPTKEVTEQDLQKAKEDLADVWQLFKDFVAEQRPSLNLNVVATGEVWFGKRAVEVGLCDSIQSADDVLTDFMDRGYDVYQVQYKEPVEDVFEKVLNPEKESFGISKIFSIFVLLFLQKVASVVQVDEDIYRKFKAKFENWDTILLS